MLFTLKEIQDYRLRTTDGNLGEINTFLIDDFEWMVRYLVVEVSSRHVMLSVLAFDAPDTKTRILPVDVTREAIMNSPTFDFNQPVSREVERRFSDYFDWPYYWEQDEVPTTMEGDMSSIPLIEMELEREKNEEQELIPETGSTDAEESKPNHHLCSTRALFGNTIHTTNDDHKAGKLVDMVTRNEDWDIPYLVVETGGLLSGKKVLIAPGWVQRIDEVNSRMDVNLTQETIRDLPPFNSVLDLTSDYPDKFNENPK
jgi:hypothetical protein